LNFARVWAKLALNRQRVVSMEESLGGDSPLSFAEYAERHAEMLVLEVVGKDGKEVERYYRRGSRTKERIAEGVLDSRLDQERKSEMQGAS
jgi:hypothetical protein